MAKSKIEGPKGQARVERPKVDDSVEEYINENLGLRMTVPKRITVREQMRYRGRIWGFAEEDVFLRHWLGAIGLIVDWTSTEYDANGFLPYSVLPDPADLDLETAEDPAITNSIHWAGNTIAGHVGNLGTVKKK